MGKHTSKYWLQQAQAFGTLFFTWRNANPPPGGRRDTGTLTRDSATHYVLLCTSVSDFRLHAYGYRTRTQTDHITHQQVTS